MNSQTHPVMSSSFRESSSCWRTTSFSTLPKTSPSSSTKARVSTRPSSETTWASGETERLSGCGRKYSLHKIYFPSVIREGNYGLDLLIKEREHDWPRQHESLSQRGRLVTVQPCGLITGNKKTIQLLTSLARLLDNEEGKWYSCDAATVLDSWRANEMDGVIWRWD